MRHLAAVLAVTLLLSTSTMSAPQWGMYHRDLARTGQAGADGPRILKVDWIAQLGAGTVANYASPVIDEQGRIYIGTADGDLHVLNSDGSPAWTYSTGATRSTFFGDENTPSAAIAGDGVVYVLDPVGTLHKLDSDGNFVWSYDSPGSSADSHPAVLPNGDILIAVYEYFPPVGANAHLISLKPDMSINFTRQHNGVGHVLSGPMVDGDGNIYVAAFQNLYNYDSQGDPLWTYPNPQHMYNTPTLAPDGNVLMMDASGFMVAVDPASGTSDWEYQVGVFSQAPVAVSSSGLAVGAAWPGVIGGINSFDGSLVWQKQTLVNGAPQRARSAPVLDAADRSYVGVDTGMIFSLDDSGRTLWAFSAGDQTRSTGAFDSEGNLYIATDSPEGAKLIRFSSEFSQEMLIGYARMLQDGEEVALPGKTVTLTGDGYFYIEEWNGSAGIRVESSEEVDLGDVVRVQGTLGTSGHERGLLNTTVEVLGSGVEPPARHVNNRDLGGGTQGPVPGPTDGQGLNTVGLLVRTSGSVSNVTNLGNGFYRFWVNDGSGRASSEGHKGVEVISPAAPGGSFVTVTGVVTLESAEGVGLVPVLRARTAADLLVHNAPAS